MSQNVPNGIPPPTMTTTITATRLPVPTEPSAQMTPQSPRPMLPIDHYRLQLYQYAVAERLRYGFPFPNPLPCYPLFSRTMAPEEPKPQHSYIGLIAMAILSSPESKLVLSDIYQYILDNYPYFRTRGPGWRNSIRHNLSLNDCFIKAGRSANGKGHYWAIHPANVDDFRKGDFRRRKAQRKVRRHMGLSVDEDGADSPSPPPLSLSPLPGPSCPSLFTSAMPTVVLGTTGRGLYSSRKRQFDVASLLAPDDNSIDDANDEDIDVVTSEHPQITHLPQVAHPFDPNNAFMQMHAAMQQHAVQMGPNPRGSTWPVLPLVSHYYHALLQARVPAGDSDTQTGQLNLSGSNHAREVSDRDSRQRVADLDRRQEEFERDHETEFEVVHRRDNGSRLGRMSPWDSERVSRETTGPRDGEDYDERFSRVVGKPFVKREMNPNLNT